MLDLTLPGYKYIGPFNDLNKGNPENWNDFVGYMHDIGYSRIEHRGGNAYIRWSKQDAQAYESWENGDYGGVLANTYYGLKKALYSMGLVGESEKPALRGHEDIKTPWIDPNPDETKKYKRRFEDEGVERYNKWRRLGLEDDAFDPNRQTALGEVAEDPARIPLPDEDDEEKEWLVDAEGKTESLTNSPTTAEASMGDVNMGSGNDGKGTKETPVDEVMNVSRGPPKFTFATLPHIEDYTVYANTNSLEFVYRMTSPYDCVATTQDVNLIATGAPQGLMIATEHLPDASDVSNTRARWFSFYAGMYKYYHTVSCRWWATLENLDSKPFWIHQYYCSDEQPPMGADNMDMLLWPDFNSHYVGAGFAAITSSGAIEANETRNTTGHNAENSAIVTPDNYEDGNHITRRGASPIVQLSGSYKTGDFDALIRQDEEVENWTLCNTNPKLQERLAFRFKIAQNTAYRDYTSLSANDNIRFKWTFKCEYLVEFKELNIALRYPVERQPIKVTLHSDYSSVANSG